jgi:hypothetical protein
MNEDKLLRIRKRHGIISKLPLPLLYYFTRQVRPDIPQ